MPQAASPFRVNSPITVRDLTACVKQEYLEMPGLALTQVQAQRLFGLDSLTFEAVFGALIDAGFLRRTIGGTFVR